MSFRTENGDHIAKEVRRIARKEVEGAIGDLHRLDHEDPETVHELRKRCKKVRGLLRLVRPAIGDIYAMENAHFRDAARSLSPLRDAHSALVAYDLLLDHYRGEVRRAPLAAVRRHLVQVEERTKHDTDDLEDRYAQVRDEMEAARRRIDDWPITDLGLETWRAGFERTYRRARRAMSAAYDDPTPEHFHEWRKAAKYHGYHVRLLRPLWDNQLHARRDSADELSDLLGEYHDVVVLQSRLSASSRLGAKALRRVQRLIDRRREEIEARARPVGMRLFAEKPRRIAARHSRYWSAWNEQQRCDASMDLRQSAA